MTGTMAEKDVKAEWDAIWSRRVQGVIAVGRRGYNYFFRRYMQPFIGSNKRFLEIGCGSAHFLTSMAPSFGLTVGFDISEVALTQAIGGTMESPAKVNMPVADRSPHFVRGDCFRLPFDDNTFDVIWSQGLHEHFSNYEEILREEFRVCRQGGIVLAGVPYYYSYPTVWYRLSRLPRCRSLWPWTEQVFFKKRELIETGSRITPKASFEMVKPWALGIAVLKLPKL